MSDTNLTTRQYLLTQINARIDTCSNLNPSPADHIARLRHLRATVQVATVDELFAVSVAWQSLKTAKI